MSGRILVLQGQGMEVQLKRWFWIKNFGRVLSHVRKGAFPIMQVLRMVDFDDKPTMGFIYKAMDQAKEKRQKEFNGDKKR